MFENLSDRLQGIVKKLKGQTRITEKELNECLREVKLALLEADVNYKIVKEFIKIRLENNPNFTLIENPTGYIYDTLAGNTIMGIHGEIKNMERALKDFSKIHNVSIQYLIAGHLHHSKSEEIGVNSEVINIPSIVGVDTYSLSLNKTSNASGKLLVFEEGKGKICEDSLKLN